MVSPSARSAPVSGGLSGRLPTYSPNSDSKAAVTTDRSDKDRFLRRCVEVMKQGTPFLHRFDGQPMEVCDFKVNSMLDKLVWSGDDTANGSINLSDVVMVKRGEMQMEDNKLQVMLLTLKDGKQLDLFCQDEAYLFWYPGICFLTDGVSETVRSSSVPAGTRKVQSARGTPKAASESNASPAEVGQLLEMLSSLQRQKVEQDAKINKFQQEIDQKNMTIDVLLKKLDTLGTANEKLSAEVQTQATQQVSRDTMTSAAAEAVDDSDERLHELAKQNQRLEKLVLSLVKANQETVNELLMVVSNCMVRTREIQAEQVDVISEDGETEAEQEKPAADTFQPPARTSTASQSKDDGTDEMNTLAMEKLIQDMEAEIAAERAAGLAGGKNPFSTEDLDVKEDEPEEPTMDTAELMKALGMPDFSEEKAPEDHGDPDIARLADKLASLEAMLGAVNQSIGLAEGDMSEVSAEQLAQQMAGMNAAAAASDDDEVDPPPTMPDDVLDADQEEDLFLKKYAGGGVAEADDTSDLLSSIPEGADEAQIAEVMRLQELITNLQDRRQMMHNTVAGKMEQLKKMQEQSKEMEALIAKANAGEKE